MAYPGLTHARGDRGQRERLFTRHADRGRRALTKRAGGQRVPRLYV